MADSSLHNLAAEIRQHARQIGFDLVGIAPASPSMYRDYLRAWLDDGQAGSMQWLHKRFDERTDPSTYLPGAKTVICVAMNYHVELEPMPDGHGRIARYALGDDYHELIQSRLHQLADNTMSAVLGVATDKFQDFMSKALPGFAEHYANAQRKRFG